MQFDEAYQGSTDAIIIKGESYLRSRWMTNISYLPKQEKATQSGIIQDQVDPRATSAQS